MTKRFLKLIIQIHAEFLMFAVCQPQRDIKKGYFDRSFFR